MTTHTLNGKNVLLVEVPEDYRRGVICNQLLIFDSRWITLPRDIDWRILGKGLASDVTEEEARGVVESKEDVVYDRQEQRSKETLYMDYEYGLYSGLMSAIESLNSFLTLHGYDPKQCVVLIQN